MDPVLVVKHELSHAIRLDHSGGSDTGNLEDPVTPGNHNNPVNRAPSANDKTEAKKADTGATKKKNKAIGPSGGVHNYEGTNIEIVPGTVDSMYNFWIRPLNRTRIPNPTYLNEASPHDDRGIIYAVDLTTDFPGTFGESVTVTLQYSEADIAGGYILGERHSAVFPAIDEQSLQVYLYDEIAKKWIPISSTLDMEANTLTFKAGHFSTYGIGGSSVTTGTNNYPYKIAGLLILAVGVALIMRSRHPQTNLWHSARDTSRSSRTRLQSLTREISLLPVFETDSWGIPA